jgi:Xaa-Pro aminopeptidase
MSIGTRSVTLAQGAVRRDEVRRGSGGKRADVQALKQAAGALGLKLVYKRNLLGRLRSAHAPEEIALVERAVAITGPVTRRRRALP